MSKTKFKIASIEWCSKDVDISLIDPTPNNYKIKTDLGRERLQMSLGKFGLAGSVIVNPNGKRYTLIDGNSRLIEAKEQGKKKISISYPTKPLTPAQFKEMSAMFDYAKAGEVDIERIKTDLGTTSDFYKKWGMEVPMQLLEQLGSKASTEMIEYPEGKKVKGTNNAESVSNIKMVNLFFSDKQENKFRQMEDVFKKLFKTNNTTDTVFKALERCYNSLPQKDKSNGKSKSR